MSLLSRRNIPRSSAQTTYWPMSGGLNTEDPSLSLKPGEAIASENYEIGVRGRYRRTDGYERFDGQTLPSNANYYKISYTSGALSTGWSSGFDSGFSPAGNTLVGATVTGDLSGAHATVLLHYYTTDPRDQSGVGYLIISEEIKSGFSSGFASGFSLFSSFINGEGLTFTINTGFSTGFSNGFE